MATTQELIDAVNALTTQTTSVLEEYTDAKINIDAKVSSATSSATAATSNAGASATSKVGAESAASIATTKASEASSSATEAKSYRDSASEISGLSTVAEAVDLALSEVYLSAMKEVDMLALRNQNNELYAASGFVHFGKRYSTPAINEGLWVQYAVNTANANRLCLGSGTSANQQLGTSLSNYPVLHMAGFCTKIKTMNSFWGSTFPDISQIKFPPAPNGTVTYDSATGEIVDYSKEVDPKYGDVASSHNEAVARAFEGGYSNSRNLITIAGAVALGDSRYQLDATTGNTPYIEVTTLPLVSLGFPYELTFTVEDTGSGRVYANIGNGASTYGSFGVGTHTIIINKGDRANGSDPTGVSINRLDSSSNRIVRDCVVRSKSVSVVTERVDMFGLEQFEEEVTQSNPYVYPNGLIQSQATSMNGVTTSSSSRPVTYYAVYDGDTGSKGKGVNFYSATVAQQQAMLSDPDNKLYVTADGKLIQSRIRQRTIAGAGNGDWENIDTTDTSIATMLRYSSGARMNAQGSANEVPALSGYSALNYLTPLNAANEYSNTGLFTSDNGEAYFLVMGTVPRLNKGAYQPSLNPMGANMWATKAGLGHRSWYHPDFVSSDFESTVQCFKDWEVNSIGKYTDGHLGSEFSGRPDGRFYDAVYASGQGGVIDYRLSAWDASSKERASEVDAMVKSGSYRGVEKLKFTTVHIETQVNSNPTSVAVEMDEFFTDNYNIKVGDRVSVQLPDGSLVIKRATITSIGRTGGSHDYVIWDGAKDGTFNRVASDVLTLVFEVATDTTVSGEFTQTDVIGDPANILQIDALKDGWLGSWIPVIPDGTSKDYLLTRKSLDISYIRVSTSDLGTTWAYNGAIPVTATTNTIISSSSGLPLNYIQILNYTAFAKQTKSSTNLPVLHGEAGLGSVWQYMRSQTARGSLLTESLIDKVTTSDGTGIYVGTKTLVDFNVDLGKIDVYRPQEHSPITLSAPQNDSPAVKALMYQVEDNSQANLNYAFNELVYDGDWGDDSTIHIADGDSTDMDDNGNTRKIGTHTLALPYGWIKIDV